MITHLNLQHHMIAKNIKSVNVLQFILPLILPVQIIVHRRNAITKRKTVISFLYVSSVQLFQFLLLCVVLQVFLYWMNRMPVTGIVSLPCEEMHQLFLPSFASISSSVLSRHLFLCNLHHKFVSHRSPSMLFSSCWSLPHQFQEGAESRLLPSHS